MSIDARSLELLELPQVLSRAAGYAAFSRSRELVSELEPATSATRSARDCGALPRRAVCCRPSRLSPWAALTTFAKQPVWRSAARGSIHRSYGRSATS